jgi:hypothetical protein
MTVQSWRRFPFAALAVAAGGGATVYTWNPSDKAAAIALSGSDLIFTKSGADSYANVRGTIGQTTGKFYFEVLYSTVAASDHGCGLANSTQSLTAFIGGPSNSVGVYGLDGEVYLNDVATGSIIGGIASGDVVAVAVDTDTDDVWFRHVTDGGDWNGSAAADPALGTGGIDISGITGALFPIAGGFRNTDAGTGRFTEASMAGVMPSGFVAWDGTGEAAPGDFTPADLPTLVAWWEADAAANRQTIAGATAISGDNDNVGYIADLSGNAKHAIAAADDTTRSVYKATAAGSPSLLGDDNTWHGITGGLGLYAAGSATIAFAVRGNSPIANGRTFFSETGTATTGRWDMIRTSAAVSGDIRSRFLNDSGSTRLAEGSVDATGGFGATDAVIIGVDTGTAYSFYDDGVLVDTSSYTRSGSMTGDLASLFAARVNGSTGLGCRVYMHAGLAMTGVATAEQIADITTYLASKQGRVL